MNQIFRMMGYKSTQIWPNQLLVRKLPPGWGLRAGWCLLCSLPAGTSVSETVELIQGELRGSVTILCPPRDTQGGKKRFWCKLGRTSCSLIADTDGYVGKSYQGRIFITPQESYGAFRILINDLTREDSGLYRCGTGRLSAGDSQRVVALQVTTGRTGCWGLHVLWGFLTAQDEEHEMLTQPSPTCSLHPAQETKISERHGRGLAVREVPL